MKTVSIYILCLTFLFACQDTNEKDETLATTTADTGSIQIVSDPSEFPQDYVYIDTVSIENNTLRFTVNYGGGCGDHLAQFQLVGSGLFMESLPVQTPIFLSLKDEDYCKAIVTRELEFDLTNLADQYKKTYQTTSGTIILRIQGVDTPVRYSF